MSIASALTTAHTSQIRPVGRPSRSSTGETPPARKESCRPQLQLTMSDTTNVIIGQNFARRRISVDIVKQEQDVCIVRNAISACA